MISSRVCLLIKKMFGSFNLIKTVAFNIIIFCYQHILHYALPNSAGFWNLDELYLCDLCRKQRCRLLVTHDDYSMMSKLPSERTSVVTILRDPVDRVFSTYEFSVEVAARFLVHPNLTSATQMAGRLRTKTKGVSTLDIWPWKYLVPWMREDLFARV